MTATIDESTGEINTGLAIVEPKSIGFSRDSFIVYTYLCNCAGSGGAVFLKSGEKITDELTFCIVDAVVYKNADLFNYPRQDWLQFVGIDDVGHVFSMLLKTASMTNFLALAEDAAWNDIELIGHNIRMTFEKKDSKAEEGGKYHVAKFKVLKERTRHTELLDECKARMQSGEQLYKTPVFTQQKL